MNRSLFGNTEFLPGCQNHRFCCRLGLHIRIVFLLCLAALMVACDGRATRGDDRTITITYWTRSWWGDPAQYQGDDKVPVWQWQQEQVHRFEAMHPNVKINLQVDPGGRGDKIRMAFAGGVAPDVFHGSPDTEFIAWADLGLLEPINPYLTPEDKADIFPAVLETVEHRGQYFAWPLYNHALGIVINRDLFRARGLEGRIPTGAGEWTMAEFERLARELTVDRDGDGRAEVYGVGIHALDGNHVMMTTYLVNFGARVFGDDGRFTLDSPAGVEGLRMLRRLIDQGVATPGATGYSYEDIRSLFLEQRVAMWLTGTGVLMYAQDQVRRGTLEPFDWTLVPVPSVPGVESTSYLTLGTVFVSRQTDPAKRDACMAFARFITGHEVNQHFWEAMSPRRSSPTPTVPYQRVMMEQVARAENFMQPPRPLPRRFSLKDELARLYQDTLAVPPKSEPAEALRRLAERINAAIDQAQPRELP